MIGASLDRDAVASSLRLAVPRDQNSCSDFNGLAPAPSMQEDEGLSLLNDVDVFYFHPSLTNDNLSSVSLSDAVSLPELDGSMQEFDGYFCSWELEGSGIDGCKDKEVFCDAIVDNASFLGDGIQQIGGQFSSPELNESASFQINESASAEMPTDGNCMGDNMQSSAISALRESDVGCSFREKGFVLFSTEKDQSHYVHFSNKRKRGDTNSNTGGREKSGSRNDALGKRQQRLLRNRKLAFESRQRKKCYIKDLEKKCKILEEERNQLQQQVGFASAENAVLRKELSRVKKVRGKGVAEPAVLFWDSLPLEFLLLLMCPLCSAQLSLCTSPFLVLVVCAILFAQSSIKERVLVESQLLLSSERCFSLIIDYTGWVNVLYWHYMLSVACQISRWKTLFLHRRWSSCRFDNISKFFLLASLKV